MKIPLALIGSVAVLVTVAAALLTALPAAHEQPSADQGLVEGPKPEEGRELILENCVLCHSTAIILSNHMSRERWDDTITVMQEMHNLWPLEPADRAGILDYLEATQGASAFDDVELDLRSSPWAQPLYRPNPIW